MNKKILILSIFFIVEPVFATNLTALEVMRRNEEVRKIADVRSSAEITVSKKDSPEQVKKFIWWRKLLPDQVHYNTLTRFYSPPSIKGQAILFLERSNDENEVLLYLSQSQTVRRVEIQNQSSSFMNSELSYSDIATPHLNEYEYKLLRKEPCASVQCYVIESKPRLDLVKTRTGTTKSVTWVREDNFMGVRGEHYDLEGKLWKRMEASDIQLVDAKQSKWMVFHLKVENVQKERFTLLKFSDVKVNQGLSDSIFNQGSFFRIQ